MKDDALSPVVAMMLILAIVVTLFSLWNSIYLPGLKQKAEVAHLGEVSGTFMKIDADIRNLVAWKPNSTVVENLPLGGGDTMVHSTRSGGLLSIKTESAPVLAIEGEKISLLEIAYTPVNNYWVNQGYSWQRGYVNITKGRISTPLNYPGMEEVEKDENGGFQVLAASLFRPGASDEIQVITMQVGKKETRSGNDIAQIRIEGNKSYVEVISNPKVVVYDVRSPFGRIVNSSVSETLSPYNPDGSSIGEDRYRYSINDKIISFCFYNLTFSVV